MVGGTSPRTAATAARRASDRAPHGGGARAEPSSSTLPISGHRRRHELARRGGVPAARQHLGAGVHGGHAARLPHRGGHDRGPRDLHGRAAASQKLDDFVGKASRGTPSGATSTSTTRRWRRSTPTACIGCQLCMVACHDGAHQCIHPRPDGRRCPWSTKIECVGCNLCQIVCPVEGCITMEPVNNGFAPATWNQHVHDGAALRPKKGRRSGARRAGSLRAGPDRPGGRDRPMHLHRRADTGLRGVPRRALTRGVCADVVRCAMMGHLL
jgi:Pyruvate/2-oxoacid:ferredoxin oxidoreductase delta subunit